MTDDLRLITGRIQKLDRKRCRGAWGVADVEHYVQTPGDPKKRKTTTAVVGNGVALFAFGDTIDAVGAYEKSDYGLQFKAIRVSLAPPDTDAEMDKWFAATLPNVDVARLAAIRAVAGTTPLRDFLSSPQAAEKLITVAGITEERAELIVTTWRAAASLHDNFHSLVTLGLTVEEIRALMRKSVDISRIAANPFLLFEEGVISLSRLEAMLKAHFPNLHGSSRHRAYVVLHSIRELVEDSSSTAARVADVLEHVQIRARNATAQRISALGAEHPDVFVIISGKAQPARLAAAERLIADFVLERRPS